MSREQAIKETGVFVVLVTPNFTSDVQCVMDVKTARDNGVDFLIAVREDVDMKMVDFLFEGCKVIGRFTFKEDDPPAAVTKKVGDIIFDQRKALRKS